MTIALPALRAERVGGRTMALAGVHVPALDGLRGVAILLVMGHHFFLSVRVPWAPANRALDILRSGWIGVDLFFVLSGFLITGILFDAKAKGTGREYFRRFFGRRMLRIFPLYFAVLLVWAALAPWTMATDDPHNTQLRHNFPWLFVYMTNYAMAWTHDWRAFEGTHVNFAHFWSLAVEEHFYLVWPFVVAALDRRALLRVCGVLIGFSVAVKVGLAWEGNRDLIPVYTLTPCRMDSLLIGAVVALAARGPGGLGAIGRECRLIVQLGLPLLIGAILLQGDLPRTTSVAGALIYPLLAVLFGALLCEVLTTGGRLRGVFESKLPRFFGQYSYGLYVFHGCLERTFSAWRESAGLAGLNAYPAIKSLVVVGVWFGVSVACAVVSRWLLEEPFLKLKRYC